MAKPVWTNICSSNLVFSIGPSSVSITVTSGNGVLFPLPAGGDFFPVTLISSADHTIVEICYCTARTGDVLTITRHQEGTTALAWSAGDIVAHQVTAGTLGLAWSQAVGGVLTGTLPNPGMAVGAAATNLGAAGGALSGTYPNPGVGLIPGRLINVQVFAASGVSVYTPTAGTRYVVVEVQGGGSGSPSGLATGAGNCAAGPPGSAGAYGKGIYFTGFSGVSVTIGAGGVGGTNGSGGIAGNGGTSSFGSLISCPGGGASVPGFIQSGSASGGNGNVSGLPSGANIEFCRGSGGECSFGFNIGQVAYGGAGGESHFGPGGLAQQANLNANSAPSGSYGAGAGGNIAVSTTLNIDGANGNHGVVIVWEFS